MKKRSLVLLLCIALVALVAVNDTLATTVQGWFKDLTALLGETLGIPTADPAALDVQIVSSTNGTLTPAHYNGDFAWSKVTPVTKTTYVHNQKNETAFVRICILVKHMDGILYHQMPTSTAAYQQNIITDEKKGFTLYTFDYKQPLATGQSTPAIMLDFALAKETTNEHLARLGSDFVKVKSFAIQADAFAQLNEEGQKITDKTVGQTPMSPATALQYALGDISTFNPFN